MCVLGERLLLLQGIGFAADIEGRNEVVRLLPREHYLRQLADLLYRWRAIEAELPRLPHRAAR